MTGICHMIHHISTQTAVIAEHARILKYCADTNQDVYGGHRQNIELIMQAISLLRQAMRQVL